LNNFAPRVGLAYRLNDRTVIRTGFGIFYGEADYITSESARWINQTPDFTEVIVNGTNTKQAAFVRDGFAPVQLPASAPVPGTNVEVSKDEFANQYSTQWFLDIQRELPGDMLLVVGYQGSKATHLYSGRNINNGGPHPTIRESLRRVRPTWNNVTLRDNGGNSNYNALVAKVEKRFSASYSLTKGFRIPLSFWPFKNRRFKNKTDFSLTGNWSQETSERNTDPSAPFYEVDSSESWSLMSKINYSFTNKVTGGVFYEFGENKRKAWGESSYQELGLDVRIVIRGG